MEQRLLVEGKTDMYVFTEICRKLGLPTIKYHETRIKYEKFIETGSWKNDFLRQVEAILPLNDGKLNFGMIIDADQDIKAKWDALSGILRNGGFKDLPKQFPTDGLVVEQLDLPKIGIWIMPDNQSKGYIEYFLLDLIVDPNNLMRDVRRVLDKLEMENRTLFSPIHRKKAELYTWLAWQEKAGLPFGTAIRANYFNLDHPNVEAFVKWAKKIFEFNEK
ncbi:MAG: DUF3226 domain-containing protein [Bacteroidota bacterium]